MKLIDANYKNHWSILAFCDQWKFFLILHDNMPDIVSLPLVGFTLVIKLKNFDLESHWILQFFLMRKNMKNTLIFLIKVCLITDLNMSCQCLLWLKLRCLCSILATSWEIRFLNFTKIVQYFTIKKSVIRSKFVLVYFVLFIFFSIIMKIVSN